MKFSRELLSAALPEWRLFFMDYVRLKGLIRATCAEDAHARHDADMTFWDAVEGELQKVSRFSEQKMEWARGQLSILEEAVSVLEETSPSDRTREAASGEDSASPDATPVHAPFQSGQSPPRPHAGQVPEGGPQDNEGEGEGVQRMRLVEADSVFDDAGSEAPSLTSSPSLGPSVPPPFPSDRSQSVQQQLAPSSMRYVRTRLAASWRPTAATSGGASACETPPDAVRSRSGSTGVGGEFGVDSCPRSGSASGARTPTSEWGGGGQGSGRLDGFALEGCGGGGGEETWTGGGGKGSLRSSTPSLLVAGGGVPPPHPGTGRASMSGGRRGRVDAGSPSLPDDDVQSVDSTAFTLFDTPGRPAGEGDGGGGRGRATSSAGGGVRLTTGPLRSTILRTTSASQLRQHTLSDPSPGAGSATRAGASVGEEGVSARPAASAVRHIRAFFTEGVDAEGVVNYTAGPSSPRVMLSPRMKRAGSGLTGEGSGGGGVEEEEGTAFLAPSPKRLFDGGDSEGEGAASRAGPIPVPLSGEVSSIPADSFPAALPRPGSTAAPLLPPPSSAAAGGAGASASHAPAPPPPSATPSLLYFADPSGGVEDYRLRFARVKKAAQDAAEELELLLQYLQLNDTAVYKACKKRDKQLRLAGLFEQGGPHGTPRLVPLMSAYLAELHAPSSPYAFLRGAGAKAHIDRARSVLARLAGLEPGARAWHRTKVYSIGCFDTFHHGHANLLRALRSFGRSTVVGIHDDASYAQLKGAPPADALEARMAAVRPYADQIFIIPSTDPTAYLAAAVAPGDLAAGRAVYVRGDDMPTFPARAWCEGHGMPIYLLPRTQAVSSTYIKLVYGGGTGGGGGGVTSPHPTTPPASPGGPTPSTRPRAQTGGLHSDRLRLAFAAMDYQGKPLQHAPLV